MGNTESLGTVLLITISPRSGTPIATASMNNVDLTLKKLVIRGVLEANASQRMERSKF